MTELSQNTRQDAQRIMIIEDDKGIQEAARMVFERVGYKVSIFPNGDFLLRDEYDLPDLFIHDKQLPGVDGLDLCRFLKSQPGTKDIPVIMLSASPHIDRLSKLASADFFLEKPFKIKTLREMAAECLNPDERSI